ncbi:MAG: ribonuclease E/G [Pseudomonadota bacterium]
MNAVAVLIECGVAETRASLVIDGEVRRFWFGPARGEETATVKPAAGDIYWGRVRRLSPAIGGAFIDIGESVDAFLNIGAAHGLTEGAAMAVRVKRPAVGTKGALVAAVKAEELERSMRQRTRTGSPPVRLSPVKDAAVAALDAFAVNGAQVEIDDASAVRVVKENAQHKERKAGQVLYAAASLDDRDVDEMLERSLSRIEPLSGGGRLVFDECEAACLIDVDAVGAGADRGVGSRRANDDVNEAAMAAVFSALDRRGIGGNIVVDFLPPQNAETRRALKQGLKRAVHQRRGVVEALTKSGVAILSLPRFASSLLEQSSVIDNKGSLRDGRVFTVEWRAKAAMRAFERAMRRSPSQRFQLRVASDICSCLAAQPQWTERLGQRYGARFTIAAAQGDESRDYDIVEQQ